MRRRPDVTDEELVEAWHSPESMEAIAKRLDVSVNLVRSRWIRLKKENVISNRAFRPYAYAWTGDARPTELESADDGVSSPLSVIKTGNDLLLERLRKFHPERVNEKCNT